MRLFCLLVFFTLFIACTAAKPPKLPSPPIINNANSAAKQPTKEQIENATEEVNYASDHLYNYISSDLAKYEQDQIMAVARDIFTMSKEEDQNKFVQESDQLEKDWNALVIFDQNLQKYGLT